eukprot:1142026-Pelagomonas_calceolata.AAC.1
MPPLLVVEGIQGSLPMYAIAKHYAKAIKSVADTAIPGAGPGKNPFHTYFWLTKEKKNHEGSHFKKTSTDASPVFDDYGCEVWIWYQHSGQQLFVGWVSVRAKFMFHKVDIPILS